MTGTYYYLTGANGHQMAMRIESDNPEKLKAFAIPAGNKSYSTSYQIIKVEDGVESMHEIQSDNGTWRKAT